MHELSVEDARGRVDRFVLRRFVRLDWLAEEPDLAEREAAALRLLAGGRVLTPQLVAVDADGSAAGVPAVLMTRLPGCIELAPRDLDGFLRGLAERMPEIHATCLPAGVSVPAYAPYGLAIHRPPAWASRPQVWQRAIEVLEGPALGLERTPGPEHGHVPGHERAFIHRDYHPGNVLWTEARVTGIVDWVNASVGSPWADVGHCRVNLAEPFGQVAADRFLDLYRRASGRTDDYHPYWDIVAAIGGLDETIDAEPSPSDEDFLARAVSRL